MNIIFLVLMAAASYQRVCLGKFFIPRSSIDLQSDVKDPDYYRLPKGITPESYNVRLIPIIEGKFTFFGKVSITLNIHEAKDAITLHSKHLKITDHELVEEGAPNVYIPILSVVHDDERDFHIIKLEEDLKVGSKYTLSMKFKGILNDDLNGFYRSSYKENDGNTHWMAVTHFEATRAREAFPCFDEPQMKAKFTISLARKTEMSSLSNMRLKGSPTNEYLIPRLPESYVWDHFEESPKMSTYLVAFIVTSFKSKKAVGKDFKVWAREDAVDQVDYSLSVGPKVLEVMHNFTNIEYALPKMDMIAVPDFQAGAMENWGLVTFRETTLLYEEGTSTAKDKQRVATVVAHELAHQWFGNLVSPEWWSFIWLNEGFARYFQYKGLDVLEPAWRLMEQFVTDELQAAFAIDALDSTHPVTTDVKTPNDIASLFDEISYNKAASVIRMMEHFLSKDTFRSGIRKYLNSRRFNTGNDIQLFEALDEQAKLDGTLPSHIKVKDIMTTWTKQIGYPVITVERDYESGQAYITQERFILEENGKKDGLRWWVPVTFTSQNSTDFSKTVPSHWMTENDLSIVIQGLPIKEWMIFNLQESGYYRVNYDDKNWKLITNYLNSDEYYKIHQVNRAQLVDDSLNLAKGGYLQYHVALDLINYLSREKDFIPWHTAYRSFNFLDARLANSQGYENFMSYVRQLINTQYEAVKFEESADDDNLLQISRSELLELACKYEHEACVTKAKKYFSDWKEGKINSVPVSFKNTVYCIGAATGNKDNWEFLFKEFLSSTVASEKALLRNALVCTNDKEILNEFLNDTISENSYIRKHNRASVLSSIYLKRYGLDIAVDFLTSNYDKIEEKYATKYIGKILTGISSRISTKEQAEKMRKLLTDRQGKFGSSERAAKQALTFIDSNMLWMDKNLAVIEEWLQNKLNE